MAGVSRYSPAERQDAVDRAFGGGSASPTDVASELGVHTATLYRWASQVTSGEAPAPTELRLVQAAEQLLRTRDYSEITMEAVAAASGVALRTAFHHFATKRELFNATIDRAATALVADMYAQVQNTGLPESPIERLRHIMHLSAEVAYAMPEAHVLFRDLGVPPARSSAPEWHDRLDTTLAGFLADAAAAGELASDVDPESTAQILGSGLRGIHAAVFEGADADQAMRLVDGLYLALAARSVDGPE